MKCIDTLFHFQYTECRQTLRKESSSRKPLRHNNVIEFPPEDIPKKSTKRKRYMEDKQVIITISQVVIIFLETSHENTLHL